jgi:hypothetical protein
VIAVVVVVVVGLRGARRGVGNDAFCLDADALCARLLLVTLDTMQAAAMTGSGGLLPLGQRMNGLLGAGVRVCATNLLAVLVAGAS